jgi:hypothetical protein
VRALTNDGHTERVDLLANRFSDLIGHPLLYLQPSREYVHEPGDLAETDHAGLRNVRDVALPEERQQVMLAQAVEIDVLHDDHLVIVDREQSVVQYFVDVGAVAAGQKRERLLNARRRTNQPLASRVFPELSQQLANQILHPSILMGRASILGIL